ncbi:MAG: arsenite methyltransferase [Rhodothermales bacterium]|nr:arsenite methyltransferase [Rhodothermales bacterium]
MNDAPASATTPAACCGSDCCDEPAARSAENEAVKAAVRDKYAAIATGAATGCCDTRCCGSDGDGFSMIGDAYDAVEGYVAEADLSLGCGLPTEHARLRAGQTVLDLGSGAGLDAFVARRIVGEAGRVIGVDFTPAMVAKARANAEALGFGNVTFVEGDIEALPLEAAAVDVVISNCVLNLVPDKARAFAEMHRVLRPGGHFCISDVVYEGTMPEAVRRSAELYAGCVAGAMERSAYLAALDATGFRNVEVVRERAVEIPAGVLRPEEEAAWAAAGGALLSVTVHGERV